MQEVLQRHLEWTATCCLASAGSAFMLTVTVPWDKPDLLRLLCFLHRGSSHVRSCYRATLGCSDVHTHTGKPHLAHLESSECPEVCFGTSLGLLDGSLTSRGGDSPSLIRCQAVTVVPAKAGFGVRQLRI